MFPIQTPPSGGPTSRLTHADNAGRSENIRNDITPPFRRIHVTCAFGNQIWRAHVVIVGCVFVNKCCYLTTRSNLFAPTPYTKTNPLSDG